MGGARLFVPVLLVAVLAVGSPAAARGNRFEEDVLREMNAVRAKHGAPPLRLSAQLGAAASYHSREMVRRGFFAHQSAEGAPFWKRVLRFYSTRGYSSWAVGENLVWSSPSLSAARAVEMWLDSPQHRENLLNPRWREVGLAAHHAWSAPGFYDGREVTVLTADFGVRR